MMNLSFGVRLMHNGSDAIHPIKSIAPHQESVNEKRRFLHMEETLCRPQAYGSAFLLFMHPEMIDIHRLL